jgi:hypothetical protein
LIQPPVPQAETALLAKIPLQLLFDYSTTSPTPGPGLDFYWKGGLKNLEEELAAYDLLYAEEDESGGVVESETNT